MPVVASILSTDLVGKAVFLAVVGVIAWAIRIRCRKTD
jgi:hypothetical protein